MHKIEHPNPQFMRENWVQVNELGQFDLKKNKNDSVILHMSQLSKSAAVYVNEKKVGTQENGSVLFACDISAYVSDGMNTLYVQNENGVKAIMAEHNAWVEFVPQTHIEKVKLTPDVDNTAVNVEANLVGKGRLEVEIRYKGRILGKSEVESNGGLAYVYVPLDEEYLWEAGNGRLYDVYLEYREDRVQSYFGLRSAQLQGESVMLNGKTVTGYEVAILSEKALDEKYLYDCDKNGKVVFVEISSDSDSICDVLSQWVEMVEHNYNHPSIVAWNPGALPLAQRITKAMDYTRPVCLD